MVIDVWMQHPTPRFLAQDFLASLRRWTGGSIPDEVPGIDATVAAMDFAGVGFGLLSAWSAPQQEPLISNDEVAQWVAAHPDRFAGLACVDLDKPMTAVRELRRCVTELGFKGLRVVPWLWNAPPTDRRYYPLYAECVELGVPFCTQVGHTGPLRPSETGRPIPYIDQVALDFPELTIVCGHVGYPWTEEMVAVARKHENVVIDTSAYTTKRLPRELIAYLKTGSGQRKVLFGTNYPMILPAHALTSWSSVPRLGNCIWRGTPSGCLACPELPRVLRQGCEKWIHDPDAEIGAQPDGGNKSAHHPVGIFDNLSESGSTTRLTGPQAPEQT